MKRAAVAQFRDLFEVFDQVNAGETVALQRPGGEPAVETVESAPRSQSLGVQSSGSTGRPKQIWKQWSELLREVRDPGAARQWKWASSFVPASFAGVQAALQAWKTGGTIEQLTNEWPDAWERVIRTQPDALSCTPTYLDLLLQNEPPGHGENEEPWSPRQITLGGEVLHPRRGARFGRRFPGSRFTVIYASAEFGVLLKTHRLDGWYECESLSRRHPKWRIREGVLEILGEDGWRSTGDLAEEKDGLMRVAGRAGSVANVGGVKVSLAQVAALAEEVPGVRRAAASVEMNGVVGQIVVLRFAPDAGAALGELEERLQNHLRQRLRKEAWPRRWVVDEVGPAVNSKQA